MSDSKTPPPIPKPVPRTFAELAALNPVPRTFAELGELNALLQALNNPNIEGVEVPKGVETKAVAPDLKVAALQAKAELIAEQISEVKAAQQTARPVVNKIFFTGLLGSGKDFAANAAGATIFGFADPLYAIASYYFDVTVNATEGKELPGIREFLQTAGQWGRATINEKYPLTPLRALFIRRVRSAGTGGLLGFEGLVDWASYGRNPDIWLDGCRARANEFAKENPGKRIAVTNCRFDNEFKALQADGWQHWHCMCSPKTWAARLAVSKLTPESPAVKDISEQLAAKLDAQVIKTVSAEKTGPQLRVIWGDTEPKPSARLHSVESFLKSIGS